VEEHKRRLLDPFLGSGTTAVVARELKCRFCGIELNPDYTSAAADRLGLKPRQGNRCLDGLREDDQD
jgi:DNA modification methylase